MPWDQALDIILKANKLGYCVDGTVVRIAPLDGAAQEEEERRKLTDAQALAGELSVLTLPLSYAKAPTWCRSSRAARCRRAAKCRWTRARNTLIIRDLPDRLTTAERADQDARSAAAAGRDRSAHRADDQRDFARAIGVQWGVNGRVDPALGNTTGLAFPNNGSLRGDVGGAQGPDGSADRRQSRRAGRRRARSASRSASVNGALNLDVGAVALESTGRGRLLSTPRVSTQNNVEAEMTQGVQIPIQTIANNTVTVTFKDAALTLRGHAADHGVEHGHHARVPRERDGRLQPRRQRHSAHRHAARRHDGARRPTARRRSSAAST